MSGPSTAEMAAHLVNAADALPNGAELLANLMMDRMRWTGDGGAPVVLDANGFPALDASGQPKTTAALIADFKREHPSFFDWQKAAAPPSAGGRWTGMTAAAIAQRDAARQREAQGLPPNPFAKQTWNLTQQVLVKARNPALAAKLQAEAGV